MEILSTPTYLTSDLISGGLDEITQGITQSTETAGPVALQNTIDTFSPENIGYVGQEWGVAAAPAAISEPASFSSPEEYLGSYQNKADSQFPDVLASLQDPKFKPEESLAQLSQNLFGGKGIVDNLVELTGVIAPPQNPVQLTGVIAPPQNPVQLTGVIAPPQNPVQVTGVIAPPQNPVQLTGVIAPPQNPVQLTGVIAPPQSYQLDHGLGGIDQTLGSLTDLDPRTSAGQQKLTDLQQQLGALNGMEKTVKNIVSVQLQMSSFRMGKIYG